jgi:hypothetical protein
LDNKFITIALTRTGKPAAPYWSLWVCQPVTQVVSTKRKEAMKDILEFLQSGNIAWAFFAIIILWATKIDLPKLFELKRSNKNKDIEDLEKIINSNQFDDCYKEIMRKRLSELVFEKYFGIRADEIKISALMKLHNEHPKEATWLILKRAAPYIQLNDNNELVVEITKYHIFGKYFTQAITFLVAAYALLLFVLGVLIQWSGDKGIIQFGALALGVLAVALLISSTNWPLEAAEKIKSLIEKYHQNQS